MRARFRVFILLSDACLPLMSYDEAREELMGGNCDGKWEDDESIFDTHLEAEQRAQRTYFRNSLQFTDDGTSSNDSSSDSDSEENRLLHDLLDAKNSKGKSDGIWAHSQWCVLSRRHAEILCDTKDEEQDRRNQFFRAYTKALPLHDVETNTTLAPDELFILSYLRDYGRRTKTAIKWRTGKTTYGRCCLDSNSCKCGPARAKHPMSLKNLHQGFILDGCMNRAIFGRKFLQGVEDKELWKWWVRLWGVYGSAQTFQSAEHREKHTREKRVEIAKMCHWQAQIVDPTSRTKPTTRQQDELAMFLSRSENLVPEPAAENCLPPSPALSGGLAGDDSSDDDLPLNLRQASPVLQAPSAAATPKRSKKPPTSKSPNPTPTNAATSPASKSPNARPTVYDSSDQDRARVCRNASPAAARNASPRLPGGNSPKSAHYQMCYTK